MIPDFDPFNPPQVPVDQALLALIDRGDLWVLFSDLIAAAERREGCGDRCMAPTRVDRDLAGLDPHSELVRRRREYRGVDGRPARAQTPEQIQARAAASWRRVERSIAEGRRAG